MKGGIIKWLKWKFSKNLMISDDQNRIKLDGIEYVAFPTDFNSDVDDCDKCDLDGKSVCIKTPCSIRGRKDKSGCYFKKVI